MLLKLKLKGGPPSAYVVLGPDWSLIQAWNHDDRKRQSHTCAVLRFVKIIY